MVGQGSLFWLQNEGGINSGWCISGGKHSHLVRKELCIQNPGWECSGTGSRITTWPGTLPGRKYHCRQIWESRSVPCDQAGHGPSMRPIDQIFHRPCAVQWRSQCRRLFLRHRSTSIITRSRPLVPRSLNPMLSSSRVLFAPP
jgi:hypothetical protein